MVFTTSDPVHDPGPYYVAAIAELMESNTRSTISHGLYRTGFQLQIHIIQREIGSGRSVFGALRFPGSLISSSWTSATVAALTRTLPGMRFSLTFPAQPDRSYRHAEGDQVRLEHPLLRRARLLLLSQAGHPGRIPRALQGDQGPHRSRCRRLRP